MRKEIPDYVDELPVVSATPDTVETVLRELINDVKAVVNRVKQGCLDTKVKNSTSNKSFVFIQTLTDGFHLLINDFCHTFKLII